MRTRESGHGRRETRTAKVLAAGGLEFPHARQVIRIIRTSTEITTGKRRHTRAHAITDLDTAQAGPHLLEHLVRRHWGIEALHYLRDTAFGEDASRVRCGHAPQNMAMLRNLAIPLLASLEHCRWISQAIRWVSYEAFTRPLDLIGLP